MSFISVFDVIGPNMIGPSSSHTAGACVIAFLAHRMIAPPIVRADFTLYGSFAKTYRGHGTDKALIAGILGMKPDDARLRDSPALAKQSGLAVTIIPDHIEGAHPNTALVTLTAADGRCVSVQGASVGGGSILITKVNGMAVEITGQYATLIVLHRDAPGTIAAVTECLGSYGVNICNFRLAREQKGGTAVMTIETDGSIDRTLNEKIRALPNIIGSTRLEPV